jgi:hypothetical protein
MHSSDTLETETDRSELDSGRYGHHNMGVAPNGVLTER